MMTGKVGELLKIALAGEWAKDQLEGARVHLPPLLS
jgi:hypothetical protein